MITGGEGSHLPRTTDTHKNLRQSSCFHVTFQVLMVASLKMAVFWDVAPCIIGVYKILRNS
jgi:hypothetical protein